MDLGFEEEKKRYINDYIFALEEFEVNVMQLANEDKRKDILLKIGRDIHSFKGSAGSFGFHLISSACHKFEDLLIGVEYLSIDSFIDQLLDMKDILLRIGIAYRDSDSKELDYIKMGLRIIDVDTNDVDQIKKEAVVESKTVKAESISSTPQTRKLKVIIAEDSRAIANLIAKTISDFDLDISFAKDGYDLLGRFIKERFDILIISYNLNIINTPTFFKIIKNINNQNLNIKAFVLTSSQVNIETLDSAHISLIIKNTSFVETIKSEIAKLTPLKKTNLLLANKALKILVIDDSNDIQQLIKASFKKYNLIQVEPCLSPLQAESKIESFKPDLIICDLQMPEMNGDDLYLDLKKKNKIQNCLVIFLTAASSDEELLKLQKLQPTAIFKKPFSPKYLTDSISKLIQ